MSDGGDGTCPSCGARLLGPWCHTCGERRRAPGDLTMRAFARNAIESITDLDSRLWRSLRTLVLDPGRLTVDWAAGRRRPWIPPLRLFLLVNVLYFLSQSLTGFNTFTTPLEIHLGALPHSELARTLVRGRMADTEEDYNLFRARFNAAAETQAKTLVITIVPFFAMLVGLLEWRRRRPFTVHLVFALHAVAFMMLLAGALDPVMVGIERAAPALMGEREISILYGLLLAAHLFLAFRGADATGPAPTAVRALLGLVALVALLYVYRLFLFFTVFYSI